MEQNYLKNKIAIVTGAGTGIGRAIAIKLAKLGADVIVSDLDLKTAKETLTYLDEGNHQAIQLDVTNRENIEIIFADVKKKYNKINILVNNAGVSTMQHLEFLTEKDWDFNINVNLKGVFNCTMAAIPYLKESKGRIVNIASMAGVKPAPMLLAHYTASKFGVVGFTKSCALELAKYGITVNCVCPGYVKTSMQDREVIWEGKLRGMTPEEVRNEYIRLTPLGRLCMPEDVADAVGFLVSPDAKFITGESINVAGGANL